MFIEDDLRDIMAVNIFTGLKVKFTAYKYNIQMPWNIVLKIVLISVCTCIKKGNYDVADPGKYAILFIFH